MGYVAYRRNSEVGSYAVAVVESGHWHCGARSRRSNSYEVACFGWVVTPAPNNGPTPIDKANATLSQCQAQAAAAAQPYMNDVKMPSANELVGTGVLATAASIFTKGNPIAIGISAASVLRKQIGGLINGLIAHNAEFAGCSISNGVNPIAFTGSF